MLKIYNTLTREKEEFIPLESGKVSLYACGVTVYDHCHLGHARAGIAADLAVRYLAFQGYHVNYVRNITDIDDKIINRANENKEDYRSLSERFIKAMHEDFSALEFVKPTHEPRATEYISEMITLIETIIQNGHAYVGKNGDVNFDVRSFKEYGCLSHHDIDQMESGVRVDISDAKKDPLDFVLWKLAKPGEPSWESPWGAGRPGWHIECSAMSMSLLGQSFDLHAGGRDLIFPHHENEIAQSESATKKRFVKTWMHAGFLQINKEKMSKSLGNFVTIRDILQDHSSEVVRFFLLASHYRSPLIYTEDAMLQTKQSLGRLYTALRAMPEAGRVMQSSFETRFIEAMDDDFNTPIALSVLFDLAHEIQRLRENNHAAQAAEHAALLKYLGNVLGILQTDPEVFFQSGAKVDAEKINALIAERLQARSDKNWARADQIRNELASMSVQIEDGPEGTTWKAI